MARAWSTSADNSVDLPRRLFGFPTSVWRLRLRELDLAQQQDELWRGEGIVDGAPHANAATASGSVNDKTCC
jgi:hypothetical protein